MFVAIEEENVIRGFDFNKIGDVSQGTFYLIAGASFTEVKKINYSILNLGLY